MSTPTLLAPESADCSLPGGVKVNRLANHCEKCRAPLGKETSICKQCGWYAVAGVFVEVDRTWETEPEQTAKSRHGGIPGWAWTSIALSVAIILESAAARALTPDGSVARSSISGVQFLLGVLSFLAAQVVGFVILMRRDSTAAVLDVILKPFKVSAMLFRDLPRRAWIVNLGIGGVIAALAAVLVIGSVPYHVLWSWHVDYRSQQALEDAVAQEINPSTLPEGKPEDKKRKTISCIIIGYELNDIGGLRVVLVAREVLGKLRYAGGIEPTGDPALLFELQENLRAIDSSRPIMPMTFDSNWVLPKYTCQISYATEQENKTLTDLRWEGDVRPMRMPGE